MSRAELIIETEMPEVRDVIENIYKVPQKIWKRWNNKARRLFNYLMHQGTVNRAVVCSTDLFGESEQTKAVLDASVWNIAWLAADRVTEMAKSK